jgi:hypothetical protein
MPDIRAAYHTDAATLLMYATDAVDSVVGKYSSPSGPA